MSRRRVSVRDLGPADHQGWMLRRKDGRSFLSSRWKRNWFVLKETSLYWYSSKTAQEAEGFIFLSGFTIEAAKECRKKHAITARHPQVVTVLMAAESFMDMNKWISKLSQAAEAGGEINTDECYSEDSDHEANDDDAHVSTSCSQETADPEIPSGAARMRRRSSSDAGALSTMRRRRKDQQRLSWLDLPGPDGGGGGGGGGRGGAEGGGGGEASVSLQLGGEHKEEEEVVNERPPDELECLYQNLKASRLTPIGRSSHRDFRASFAVRCPDEKLNQKLHLLRITSSTLKAKESELLVLDQILGVEVLTAPAYRTWRNSNEVLLQEINQRRQETGSAAQLRAQDALTPS